jgi:hypothetical protein
MRFIEEINKHLSEITQEQTSFTMKPSPIPHRLQPCERDGYSNRYKTIMEFFEISANIVSKIFNEDKNLRSAVIGPRNDVLFKMENGWQKDFPLSMPIFFRTDEAVPGKIVEIQCPGSGLAQLCEFENLLIKKFSYQKKSAEWEKIIVNDIRTVTKKSKPKMIYIPKSSCRTDTLIFIKKTEMAGLEYINNINEGELFSKK